MAKIIIGDANIHGILRPGEDVDLAEYAIEDGKYVAKAGGKVVGHLRHKVEWDNHFEEGDRYWELDIPSWDYPEQNFMLIVKQKV